MGIRSFTVARSSGALALAPATRHGRRWLYLAAEVDAAAAERAAGRERGPCRVTDCPLRGTQGRDGMCREHAALVEQLGARVEELRGRPSPVRSRGLTPAERFASRVRPAPTGCELWVGSRTSGYGHVRDGAVMRKAHIVAFERTMGRPVQEGMELDHECEEKLCVRVGPGHVVEVTHLENMRRLAARFRARKAAEQANVLPFRTSSSNQTPAEKVTPMPCAA